MSMNTKLAGVAVIAFLIGLWTGYLVKPETKPKDNWVSTGNGYTIVNSTTGEIKASTTGRTVSPPIK